MDEYNNLVDTYLKYNEDLEKISSSIVGFASLMQAYYNVIDLGWYLKSGLMPTVTMGNTDAEEQGLLLQIKWVFILMHRATTGTFTAMW